MTWLQSLPLTSVPLYGIAIAAFLIYVPFGVVAVARLQAGYEYSAPRAMFDKLPASAQRASWAHQNAFESFSIFAIAALMAYVTGPHLSQSYWGLTGAEWVAGATVIYLLARLAYAIFYIADLAFGRSLVWAVGQLCIAGLFVISLLSL
ncbi:MAPEG family protein [Leptolyngbya sp. FACHB-261]|uniref:MAPEG family protein n=1 Tax=Leptolyngbya sp. FACHB-261 TaxID=2692806 RepID=UPI00168908F8|nr:MAPEG family protein [Leptolyngbya sp. FACHB-261]MBD2103315.1 MAPEG family protein [Leptolyngbya sp. FACHB-261]